MLIDGEARNACLTLAAQADGCEVVTIEGLATRSALHPLQAAFKATQPCNAASADPVSFSLQKHWSIESRVQTSA